MAGAARVVFSLLFMVGLLVDYLVIFRTGRVKVAKRLICSCKCLSANGRKSSFSYTEPAFLLSLSGGCPLAPCRTRSAKLSYAPNLYLSAFPAHLLCRVSRAVPILARDRAGDQRPVEKPATWTFPRLAGARHVRVAHQARESICVKGWGQRVHGYLRLILGFFARYRKP